VIKRQLFRYVVLLQDLRTEDLLMSVHGYFLHRPGSELPVREG
jgi:hypothetical protein